MKTYSLKKYSILNILFILLLTNCFAANKNPEISIVTGNLPQAPVLNGLSKLTGALQVKNISFEKVSSMNKARGKSIIVIGLASGENAATRIMQRKNHSVPKVPGALTIWKTEWQKKQVWVISGFDERGLMYGLLDIADRISWSKEGESPMDEVKEITEEPYVKERAISIYTMNRAYWESRFYDGDYWAHYLDMLAKNRFNNLTVIFGYENGGFLAPPYPYFFDVKGFPDIQMVGLNPQDQQRNLAALNRLIKMAHARGINVNLGIWNHIYRGSYKLGGRAAGGGQPKNAKRGVVRGVTADNLTSYTKAALDKLLRAVPNLDGIQFRMHGESGLKESEMEAFWIDAFELIKEDAPDMSLTLRAKGMPESVIQSALDIGVKFKISTKYWMEQMGMPFHPTHINRENQFDRRHSYADMLHYPQEFKIYWRLWNGGTNRILLWGDPEYVQRFVESTHLYSGDGFEVNEPLATKMLAQSHNTEPFDLLSPEYNYYEYEFERYWHFFQVFGRIGYNPEMSADVWEKEFNQRFGKKAAPIIEEALHKASWILPRIVASVYPYSGFPTTRGWPERQRLGDLPVYAEAEGSDIQLFENFDKAAQRLLNGGKTVKVKPSRTSRWFENTASDIKRLIAKAEKDAGDNRNKEFISTITDLKILSNLALYHSRRIPAAVSYRLFERTKDVSALEDAIAYERNAIEAWRQIVDAAGDIYNNNLMFGIHLEPELDQGTVIGDLDGHWKDGLTDLEHGLADLKQKRENFKPEGETTTAPLYKAASNVTYNELFKIKHNPITSLPVGKPFKVRVKINAPKGIKWVRLRYRSVNQEQNYRTLKMIPTKEKDVYQAIVSADNIDPKWDFMYFIEIMDSNGNGRIYPNFKRETPYIFVELIR